MRALFASLKAIKAFALMVLVTSSTSALAGELDPLKDGSLVINHCVKMVQSQKTTLKPLLENGFELTKKPKRWVYSKKRDAVKKRDRARMELTTVPNDVGTGCQLKIWGIARSDGDRLYRELQSQFLEAGYRSEKLRNGAVRSDYFVKGQQAIYYRGITEGSFVEIRFHHRREEK